MINKCPSCGTDNVPANEVSFTVNNITFKGIQCSRCRAILYSYIPQDKEDIQRIKERMQELISYQSK